MSQDQTLILVLLAGVLAFFIWGRWRYDLVAFVALLIALIAGLVPVEAAFLGFGHPATVTVALVLIISRALSNSGAVDIVGRHVTALGGRITAHIGIMGGLAAALSAVMNNVGALALLMPVELQAAAKAKRSAAQVLMPLSFASILGGLVTLIGTPPNIIIAAFRAESAGAPFAMFDFTPVGGVIAVAGVLFIAFVGWRLIPQERFKKISGEALFDLEDYIAEARIPEGASVLGKKVRELDDMAAENHAAILGLIRGGQRLPGMARRETIREGDLLVVEGGAEDIDKLVSLLGAEYVGVEGAKSGLLRSEDVAVMEVAVPAGARAEGRSAANLRLRYRYGVNLLGVSRQGNPFRDRVHNLEIQAGDVLLLQGNAIDLPEVVSRLGCLPLAGRGLQVGKRGQAGVCVAVFALAIAAASLGLLALPVALACAATVMVLMNLVPLRDVYDGIDWPVIVLLGAMIPIGGALEATGGTQLIADALYNLSAGLPAAAILVLLMVVTMTLSDIMNNAATAVVAAPIAVRVAENLGVNPDAFLMAVAIGASSAFLTPIGHQNNTLIMGPAGYRFGDYWRMGLPLEILIVAVGTPMILWIWPL
ncbi:MAG: SLC13 family permease [Alphaproteobacteria bacterium]|nr:SLC13 family permease [Alphaproteobacteria bacterium]